MLLRADRRPINIRLLQPRFEITHATGRHAGGHLVAISPERHRRLMDILGRQSVITYNRH